MTVEFRLLGDVEARVDGRLVDLGHLKQRLVLVALLVEANRIVPVDQLVERVWAERPPQRARDTLYGYLHRLRKALAVMTGVDILRKPGGYLLSVDEALIDVYRFRELVRQARAADDDSTAMALFGEALTLWRGEPFSGVDTPWLDGAATSWRRSGSRPNSTSPTCGWRTAGTRSWCPSWPAGPANISGTSGWPRS